MNPQAHRRQPGTSQTPLQIGTTTSAKPAEKENDSWRSTAAPGAPSGDSPAAARPGAAAARAAAAAAAANPRGPPPPEASVIQKASDIGRQKWAPAKDLTSTAQAQQKLRGLLNKLTPDNFDRLTPQVPPPKINGHVASGPHSWEVPTACPSPPGCSSRLRQLPFIQHTSCFGSLCSLNGPGNRGVDELQICVSIHAFRSDVGHNACVT